MKWSFSLVVTATLTAWAQQSPLQGPTAGFVYDPIDQCIQPLMGYPGAAYLSTPVLDQLSKGSVGPNGTAAVVLKGGAVLVISDLRRAGVPVTVASALTDWDRLAWASDAKTAVLYSAASAQAVVIRNIDSVAVADPPVTFLGPSGELTALAISNDAAAMIVGVSGADAGGLFLVRGGVFTLLVAGKNFTGAAFDPSGGNVFATDRDAHLVWQVSASAWSASPFADSSDGVTDPVGVSMTNRGSTLVVANAQSPTVSLIDITSRNLLVTVALDTPPADVIPLVADIFLLTPRASPHRPVFILQTSPEPAAYFVPAARVE